MPDFDSKKLKEKWKKTRLKLFGGKGKIPMIEKLKIFG